MKQLFNKLKINVAGFIVWTTYIVLGLLAIRIIYISLVELYNLIIQPFVDLYEVFRVDNAIPVYIIIIIFIWFAIYNLILSIIWGFKEHDNDILVKFYNK